MTGVCKHLPLIYYIRVNLLNNTLTLITYVHPNCEQRHIYNTCVYMSLLWSSNYLVSTLCSIYRPCPINIYIRRLWNYWKVRSDAYLCNVVSLKYRLHTLHTHMAKYYLFLDLRWLNIFVWHFSMILVSAFSALIFLPISISLPVYVMKRTNVNSSVKYRSRIHSFWISFWTYKNARNHFIKFIFNLEINLLELYAWKNHHKQPA